jgi:hypothetical protein
MESNVMIKHKFVDFIVNEIEVCQKQMYENDGEGKLAIKKLIEIYTLVTDGKFDGHGNTKKVD